VHCGNGCFSERAGSLEKDKINTEDHVKKSTAYVDDDDKRFYYMP